MVNDASSTLNACKIQHFHNKIIHFMCIMPSSSFRRARGATMHFRNDFLRFEIAGDFYMLFTIVFRVVRYCIAFFDGFGSYLTTCCYLQYLSRPPELFVAMYMQSVAHINFDLFFTVITRPLFSRPALRLLRSRCLNLIFWDAQDILSASLLGWCKMSMVAFCTYLRHPYALDGMV